MYHSASTSNECSASLAGIFIVCFLDLTHSNRYVGVFHCCFNWQFPNEKWFWGFLLLLICHLYIFFDKVFVQILFCISKLSWYYYCWVLRVICFIFWLRSSIIYIYFAYDLSSLWPLFKFSLQCFPRSRIFNLIKSSVSFLFFYESYYWC